MKVLLVEDDAGIGRVITRGLRTRGVEVDWERCGANVSQLVCANSYNTIILDLLLPDADGLDICRDIRRAEIGTPILMVTSRSQLEDRLDGLAAGADDYLIKPFAYEELLARLRTQFWRDKTRQPDPVIFGQLRIEPAAERVTCAGDSLPISGKAYNLLLALARAHGDVVERHLLIDSIWGEEVVVSDNALDVCASGLRRLLAPYRSYLVVEAAKGRGYALRAATDQPLLIPREA